MKPKLAIVTGNAMKFEQLSFALGAHFDCEQKEIPGYHEIQGTADEILAHKLDAAYAAFQMPVLVDDVSVYFEILNGFPGPYMRSFLEVMHPYELGERFTGEKARVECKLGLRLSPERTIVATGTISGHICRAKKEEKDIMHFDICMQVDGMPKRMHDYTTKEKNEFSHRGLAIKELVKQLQ